MIDCILYLTTPDIARKHRGYQMRLNHCKSNKLVIGFSVYPAKGLTLDKYAKECYTFA